MFEGSRDANIVAKFLKEVAFQYRPTLTIKVGFLIDPLQCLSALLKSESSNVWDCLENVNHPIFLTEFFQISVQEIPGFVLVRTR